MTLTSDQRGPLGGLTDLAFRVQAPSNATRDSRRIVAGQSSYAECYARVSETAGRNSELAR